MVDEASIRALVGHRFPGGSYTIEHWENFLLTECTGAQIMRDRVVHPVALFHVPIIGCNTSIAEMFELGQAESDKSILIESYDWEMLYPLLEDTTYSISGQITAAERQHYETGQPFDRIQFCFEMKDADKLVSRVTVTWHYTRDGDKYA